jgi:hypothetical protein
MTDDIFNETPERQGSFIWTFRVIGLLIVASLVVSIIAEEVAGKGAGDIGILLYVPLSLLSAVLVFIAEKRRGVWLSVWVPAMLFFCFLALPLYLYGNWLRRSEIRPVRRSRSEPPAGPLFYAG